MSKESTDTANDDCSIESKVIYWTMIALFWANRVSKI